MRILFCNSASVSLGVEYLSAVLKKAGHEVDLISDPGLDSTTYWHIKALRRLNRYKRLAAMARQFEPDLVAFSALSNNYPSVLELSREIKKVMDVPTIIGGTHATALPEHVLKNPHMDMVCLGEGEEPLLELVTRMERGEDVTDTRSIWFKKDGKIIQNPLRPLCKDLDSLPFPDKELFRKYRYHQNSLVMSITSRGCPYSCSYCEVSMYDDLYGRTEGKFRRRSVDNVMAELLHYRDTLNPKQIFLVDPIFLTNTNWVVKFLERYNREIDLPFMCNGRPENINDRLVEALSQCRESRIFMGLDSGDKSLRKAVLNRHCTDERILNATSKLKAAGIPFHLSAMFALPGESEEEMWKTVEMIERIKPTGANTYTIFPFPGTAFYHKMIQENKITPERLEEIKDGKAGIHMFSVINHPHAKLAMTIANMLPLYMQMPNIFKPVLKWMMKMRLLRLSYLFYIPLGLILFPKVSLIQGWNLVQAFINAFRIPPLNVPDHSKEDRSQPVPSVVGTDAG